jgi:hypothetical protein
MGEEGWRASWAVIFVFCAAIVADQFWNFGYLFQHEKAINSNLFPSCVPCRELPAWQQGEHRHAGPPHRPRFSIPI